MRSICSAALLAAVAACGSSTVSPPAPGSGSAPRARIVQLDASGGVICALRDDGTVRCWGGDTNDGSAVPVAIPGLAHITQISHDVMHLVALDTAGRVFTVDLESLDPLSAPHPAALPPIAAIGYDYALARDGSLHRLAIGGDADGTDLGVIPVDRPEPIARLWGQGIDFASGEYGQVTAGGLRHTGRRLRDLGDGLPAENGMAYEPVSGSSAAIADTVVRAVGAHTGDLRGFRCTLDTAGAVRCHVNLAAPAAVALPSPPVDLVGTNGVVCALGRDGEAYCWGVNATGLVGDGTLIDRDTPVRVDLATSATASAATLAYDRVAAGPAFDWTGLPADCKRPTQAVDATGKLAFTVQSAYAYTRTEGTQIVLADFGLADHAEDRDKLPTPARGHQRAAVLELGTLKDGPFQGDRVTYESSVGQIGEGVERVAVAIAHLDERWVCGTATWKGFTQSFAARIAAR